MAEPGLQYRAIEFQRLHFNCCAKLPLSVAYSIISIKITLFKKEFNSELMKIIKCL